MKILFAFGCLPVPVFYISLTSMGGTEIDLPWPFILIKPQYRDDVGLHKHELTHAEQAFKLALIGSTLLYWLSKRYRMWAEVQAYREQIACYPAGTSIDFAVTALATKYGLGISQEQARQALTVQ